MNILEKFLELYKKCIIIISGFEQLHLSEYAEKLANNFNFDLVKFDYPNYDILNQFVKNNYNKSLVIYGLSFEKDLLTFRPNIHISLSGSKQLINNDEKYNIYTENVKKSFINKFKNLKDLTYSENTYDDIFDLVINMIKKKVYGDRLEEVEKTESEESEKEKKKKETKKDEIKPIEKQLKKEDESTSDSSDSDISDLNDTTEDKIIRAKANNITENSESVVGGRQKRISGTRNLNNSLHRYTPNKATNSNNSLFFLTLTNTGYINYTLNCLKSLEKINFDIDLHCYCIGKNGFEILKSKGYKTTLIDEEENSKFETFRKGNWSQITFNKFKIIYENLLKYNYVCITDGDIVFENSNFMNYLLQNINDNDILIQNDTMFDNDNSELCSGFMFIKSNQNTLELFNPKIIESNKRKLGWDDQVYINNIKNKLKYKKLPLDLFPTGKYYYTNHKKIKPYIIHFNWVIGHKKQDKMIKYNKWLL